MKAIVGIDPGKTGGVCCLFENDATPLLYAMPTLPEFINEFSSYKKIYRFHVYIEKAQVMPFDGKVGAFGYGKHFGEILGVLMTLEIPHTLVPPTTWTKVMHQGTAKAKPKERSLEAVSRLAPGVDFKLGGKKPHTGIVDAYLIAKYGERQG